MKNFYQILANTLIANITTSYLWFALTFWAYIKTESVLATGFIGGAYMLLIALCSMWFGTIVDNHKKRSVMLFASGFTMVAFLVAGIFYVLVPNEALLTLTQPWFWLFASIILIGAVVENMRNISLSTVVTLLVEKEKRANANGLVGMVQGIGFMITGALSGISIGFLGMGWTIVIACVLTVLSFIHMLFVQIPEKGIVHDPELKNKKIDVRGSIAAIKIVPGLFGLLFFSMFNNFVGGVYMALMDPYGLTLFSPQVWGFFLSLTGTGFILGGILVAKFGLGKNPIKTLLYVVIIMGLVGAIFTIREWTWIYVLGIWIYMSIIPIAEATEQTVIQRVVPYEKQGRVFGFAQALESSATPITAFLVAPIAQFFIIPFMNSDEGKANLGWLLGDGEVRGIALIFLISGLIMVFVAILAFASKTYRQISAFYAKS